MEIELSKMMFILGGIEDWAQKKNTVTVKNSFDCMVITSLQLVVTMIRLEQARSDISN